MLRVAQELLRYVVPVAIIAVGFMLFFVVKQGQAPPANDETPDRRPIVQTTAVRQHQGGLQIEVDGLVVPYREILVSAEVGGRVITKSPKCEAGTYVDEGEVLLAIDPEDYRLEYERLASEIKQAQFNLQEVHDDVESTQELIKLAQRDLNLRRAQHQRLADARQRNSAISVQQVDEAEQSVIAAHNSLLQLDSQLDKARIRASGLEQAINVNVLRQKRAKRDWDRTTIKAPAPGVIIREDAEQDSYVRMGDPLVLLEDTSAVEVRCNLKMEELRWIWNQAGASRPAAASGDENSVHQYRLPPTPVEVRYELGGDVFIWDGVLSRFDGLGLDERTRTVPCLVVVNDPDNVRIRDSHSSDGDGPRALVRGMFVTAIIKTQPKTELLSVPEEAVQPGNVVWSVKDGKLKRSQVEVVGVDKRFAMRVTEMGLAGRTTSFLQEHGLSTLRDLVRKSETQLRELPNFDDAMLGEITSQLNQLGLQLGMQGDLVIIDAGDAELSPGERVVTSPLSVAYSGMEVRAEEAAASSGSAGASPSQASSPSQGDENVEGAS